MKILYEASQKQRQIRFSGTVKGLIVKLRLQPNATLIARDNVLLTDQDRVNDKDSLLVMSVVSGG